VEGDWVVGEADGEVEGDVEGDWVVGEAEGE
jgi:hypothetical protein